MEGCPWLQWQHSLRRIQKHVTRFHVIHVAREERCTVNNCKTDQDWSKPSSSQLLTFFLTWEMATFSSRGSWADKWPHLLEPMKFQGASGPRRRMASLFWQSPTEHVESLHEHCRWCVLGGSLKAVASCLFLVGTLLHFLHLFLGFLKPWSTFQLLLFSHLFLIYTATTRQE